MHQTGAGKKTGAGQIRHSASDCSLLLCRSLSESKRNKPVGCLFHAACGKFPTFLLYSRHCSSGADPGRHVLLRSAFSAVSCAQWELSFLCFRSCRSLLCTGNAKTASAAAAPARDSARQQWNCHPMDPWKSPATVSSARNVLIRVQKAISAAG